jgi:hypothetical protein
MRNKKIITAAENMDWQQVVLNGGPPCFHLRMMEVFVAGLYAGRVISMADINSSRWPHFKITAGEKPFRISKDYGVHFATACRVARQLFA